LISLFPKIVVLWEAVFDQSHREPLAIIEGLLQRQSSSADMSNLAPKLPSYWRTVYAPDRCGDVVSANASGISDCSGQLIPDTALSFSSATAGASPSLN
jgi:hypothetical protein